MITISLCMIVRNEQQVLRRCLNSVREVPDEIILVDTGSEDGTRALGVELGARVYDFPWQDDFSAARNASFSHARMDYILWLDADDLLPESSRQQLLALKKELDPGVDAVMLPYQVAFDAANRPTLSYYRERLLRRAAHPVWEGAIHEAITPSGRIEYRNIPVWHKKQGPGDPDRNLRIFEGLIEKGKTLSPREQYYYARELMFHDRYRQAADLLQAFLERKDGWLENQISACCDLAACLRALNEPQGGLRALLHALELDAPRAEVLCEIGAHFLEHGPITAAIFWYEAAARLQPDPRSCGFVNPDCYGFIPHIQLCVCYDRLGDYKQAQRHNELAGELKPEDPAYLHNRAYLASLK